MNTELDHAREIAERIARRVGTENPSMLSREETVRRAEPKAELSSELAAVRAGLNDLHRKIAQLEAKVSSDAIDSRTISS
jgi:bacterioferritin (cytochrome b1)